MEKLDRLIVLGQNAVVSISHDQLKCFLLFFFVWNVDN